MQNEVQNEGLWLTGRGEKPELRPAEMYEPGDGELLIKVNAVAVQPSEWKIQEGIIPIPLKYPTIIGLSVSGTVEKVGNQVVRFQPGDRVLANTTGVMRNDSRYGAYQRFCLAPAKMAAKIADVAFPVAANIASSYASAAALCLHLGLNRPAIPKAVGTGAKILIWGVSSSLGAFAAQFGLQAGYDVVGVASRQYESQSRSLGLAHFVDRASSDAVSSLISLGPYKAIFAAADSPNDQQRIGEVLAAHGGGSFLSSTGVRSSTQLPEGVSGRSAQFLKDFLDEKNTEFREWFWWTYLEKALSTKQTQSPPVRIVGGLSETGEAWKTLKQGGANGKRLIISPQEQSGRL